MIGKFNRLLSIVALIHSYIYDLIKYLIHSRSVLPGNNKDKTKTEIMLLTHSLEKGLCFEVSKDNFGDEKSAMLINKAFGFYRKYGMDEILVISVKVLEEYFSCRNIDDIKFNEFKAALTSNEFDECYNRLCGGSKSLKQTVNEEALKSFTGLVSTRSSVRSFNTDRSIDEEEIRKALLLAQMTPSVCNRQTSRLHVFRQEQTSTIIADQMGDQGWTGNSDRLFVITSNLNYFSGIYERNQCYIDSGMFAMQFILALHAQNIGSCCKLYVRSPGMDKQFYKITGIPKNEIPTVLILAGHYKEETTVVPQSQRLNSNNIITFH